MRPATTSHLEVRAFRACAEIVTSTATGPGRECAWFLLCCARVYQMFTKTPNSSAKARGAFSSGPPFQEVPLVGEGGIEPPTPCL
jgi:hypothetical protein